MSLDTDLVSIGIQHHQAGRVEQALAIYRQALVGDPQSAAVLSLLGAACINLRRWDEAFEHLQAALRSDPNHPSVHDNLGVLLARQGQIAEAVKNFRRAAELSPDNPQTQLNLAAALDRLGDPAGALETYRVAAHLSPNSFKAHREASRLLQAAGRLTEAVPHLRQMARLKSRDPEIRFELAAALAQAGQVVDAITAYQEVLSLKPDSAEACVNLAQVYIQKRDYQAAVEIANEAVKLRPHFAEAHLNLATALMGLDRNDEARVALETCVRLKPELAQAYNNLGNLLANDFDFAGAQRQYRLALKYVPENPQTLYNLGIAVLRDGDVQDSLEFFERALLLAPNYAEAHHNRASALLLLGRYEEGLAEYEWRFKSRDFPAFRPRWKVWEGGPAAGKTLVLVAEQGLGDTLQFVRYASLLEADGARVIVECNPALHPILARTPGVSQWTGPADPAPAADGCVPMMSMPHRMETEPGTIPADVPYIFADKSREAAWRDEVIAQGEFRVGIAWQGNPHAPFDRERSIPLKHFAPIAGIPGVRLFSLQKGEGSEQLAAVADAWGVVDFGARLDAHDGAFMDTAAIMRNLDLVITSDTAVAHLAGALGVPTWVALTTVPDWRWLLEREDSPWYPTMRLFRQRTFGDWDEVFERVARELELLSRNRQ